MYYLDEVDTLDDVDAELDVDALEKKYLLRHKIMECICTAFLKNPEMWRNVFL